MGEHSSVSIGNFSQVLSKQALDGLLVPSLIDENDFANLLEGFVVPISRVPVKDQSLAKDE